MSNIQESEIKSKKFNLKLAELSSLIFWMYFTIKLIFIDFDVLFIQKYMPGFNWLIKYKFFVLIVSILILWLILKSEYLLKFIGFLVIYPFFLFFWRIPKLLLRTRNWIGVFAALEIIISFFKRIKYNFILFVFVSISALLILTTDNSFTLIPSILILFIYLIVYFIGRFKYAFHPFSTITLQSDALGKIWSNMSDRFKYVEIEESNEQEDETESDSDPGWAINLQFVLIIDKICYFLISKLKRFKRSKVAIAYSLLSIIGTVFITIIIFSFINFALFKISPSSFSNSSFSKFIYFIYYSFNTIFTNSINDFYPVGDVARLVNSMEIFFGFIILVILFFILTTIFQEKHNEQIDGVIVAVDSQATEIEKFIKAEYKLTPIQALKEIEKIKGSMLKVIYYFLNNIE